jgi:hypothetical protein
MILISEKCYYYNNQKVKKLYASKFYYYLNFYGFISINTIWKDNNHEDLEKICINFHSINRIKNWIQNTLSDMYNDVDLFGELEFLQSSPKKYDSVKKKLSETNINSSIV